MTQSTATKISELTAGEQLTGMFACSRKERLTARSGAPYLQIELSDASGKIPGRAFRDVEYLDGLFARGDVVRVTGRIEQFRGARQFNISAITRVEAEQAADPRSFLPSAYRDIEELDGFLEHFARDVFDPELRRLLDAMLGDQTLREQLRTAPCTRNGHHAYLGGLLEHTVAVTTLAQATCELHPRLDSDLLLTAAILHDIGKLREFEYGAEISTSAQGRLLGHVTLGVQLIGEWVKQVGGIEGRRELALLNCVLSHHGPPDGSRGFASAEASALYRVNAVDAQVKGALEHGVLAGATTPD